LKNVRYGSHQAVYRDRRRGPGAAALVRRLPAGRPRSRTRASPGANRSACSSWSPPSSRWGRW